MKAIILYLDDAEREKWYNEYHRLEAKSLMSYSWGELKPVIIEFLTEEGYEFRKNARWFILIQILFELCLKTKRMLIGHDMQLAELVAELESRGQAPYRVNNKQWRLSMRRDKQWWARLGKQERSELVYLERIASRCGGGRSAYLPDDCSECGNCSTPHIGYGLCPSCSRRLHVLLRKANDGLFVITATEIRAAELQW